MTLPKLCIPGPCKSFVAALSECREGVGLMENDVGCAMRVHSTPGWGFLGSVYQRAPAHELESKAGLKVECGKAVTVHYDVSA